MPFCLFDPARSCQRGSCLGFQKQMLWARSGPRDAAQLAFDGYAHVMRRGCFWLFIHRLWKLRNRHSVEPVRCNCRQREIPAIEHGLSNRAYIKSVVRRAAQLAETIQRAVSLVAPV